MPGASQAIAIREGLFRPLVGNHELDKCRGGAPEGVRPTSLGAGRRVMASLACRVMARIDGAAVRTGRLSALRPLALARRVTQRQAPSRAPSRSETTNRAWRSVGSSLFDIVKEFDERRLGRCARRPHRSAAPPSSAATATPPPPGALGRGHDPAPIPPPHSSSGPSSSSGSAYCAGASPTDLTSRAERTPGCRSPRRMSSTRNCQSSP